MLPLVLYDIPSKLADSSWSPNTAKTRFVLGYKNLPFKTVWVEYPDIAPKLKEIGIPINKLVNGTERYTLPVLSDPNTNALIVESWAIAEYLDKTYPEKPIFPKSTKGLIDTFGYVLYQLLEPAFGFGLLRTSQILNERSRECYIHTRPAPWGDQDDEWSPEGPKRDAQWEVIEKKYYETAKAWYEREEGKWLMGDTFSYADILFAARSLWFKRILQDDEWRRIVSLHDGKWAILLADVERECNLS